MTQPAKSVMRGITLMVIAMFYVPTLDAVTKILTDTLPPVEIALGRFIAQAAVAGLLGLLLRKTDELRPPPRAGAHVARGLFLAATAFFFISALSFMPLTDALAIAFLEPLLLTAVSPVLLGETVGWRRWTAGLVGFAGTLFVIQPTFEHVGWSVLFPVASAVTFAGYHVMTRKISGAGSVLSAQWMTGVSGTIGLAIVLTASTAAGVPGMVALWPAPWEIAAIAAVGFISYTAHGLIVRAFDQAPASVLAPFGYLELVTATALGYFIWGDLPSWMTWAGIALIVGAGLYSAHREVVRLQSTKVLPHQ